MKKTVLLFTLLVSIFSIQLKAQESTFEIYGFVMSDMGYDFKTVNPDWYDVLRPTKLPSFEGEFAPDGKVFFGVRQTRFGVKSFTPTPLGDLKTTFEFNLFGTGADAGQTTFRLRHAYGELGKFGAGQTWSAFMDSDVFPNIIEYNGPPGMVWYRNIQVRYMPIEGVSRLTFALEKPGGSADDGEYSDRVELEGTRSQFYFPDLTGQYRYGDDWGYVQLSGIVKSLRWVDPTEDTLSLDGSAVGWGGNLSSNINITENDKLILNLVYGEGIENYMNDAPADVGLDTLFSGRTATRPIKRIALPVTGIVSFLNHSWSKYFTSSVGYSMINIDNSNAQLPIAFKRGQYVIANLLYYPVPSFMAGVEYQWGERQNKGGFISTDTKIQFSVKANFSKIFSFK